jgi:flagellar motility protein MotE (MotC chaperone)
MIRFARTARLLPIAIIAAVSLFALKVSGLLFDGGYTLGERLAERGKPQLTITTADSVPAYPKIVMADGKTRPASPSNAAPDKARLSWAEEMFNFGNANPDITGSVPEPEEKDDGPKLKVTEKPPVPTKLEPSPDPVTGPGASRIASSGERAILQRLQQRRKQLDKRNRDLDMRESLLKAAEKRVEARVNELKELESKVKAASGTREKTQKQHFASLVAMYEAMRPKEAARIFDRLDINILVEVATGMKARSMSAILAQMTPEAAERLTVELANRAAANDAPKMAKPDQLPKIGNAAGAR